MRQSEKNILDSRGRRGLPERVQVAGVWLLALGGGTQLAFGPVGLGLIGLMLLLCVRGSERRLPVPHPVHPAVLAVAAAACLSWSTAYFDLKGLRDFGQFLLLGGFGLYSAAGLDREWARRHFLNAVTISFFASLTLAFLQLFSPEFGQSLLTLFYGAPYASGGNGPTLAEELATGLMPSQSLYAAFLIVTLPFVLVRISRFSRWALWICAPVICFIAGETILSAGALALLGTVALFTIYSCPQSLLPQKRWIPACSVIAAMVLVLQPEVRLPKIPSPWDFVQPFSDHAGEDRQVKRLGIEAAAAVHSLRERPLGQGPGSYRDGIREARMRAQLPRPRENRVRRDSNSQYAVIAVEYGLPTLLAVFCLIAAAVRNAVLQRLRNSGDENRAAFSAAILAAIAAVAGSGSLTVFFVKGLGPLASFLLGLGLFPSSGPAPNAPGKRVRLFLNQALIVLLALLLPVLFRGERQYSSRIQSIPAEPGRPPLTDATAAPEYAAAADFFVEAEEAEQIVPHFVREEMAGAGNNSVLSIPFGTGKGTGRAVIGIDVPFDGRYRMWFRAYWEGGCANSVLCRIDGGRQLSVEDSVFERWHWVDVADGSILELEAGRHSLQLENSEDGIHIDQIAFLVDVQARPAGIFGRNGDRKESSYPRDGPEERFEFAEERFPEDEAFDKYGQEK